MKTIICCLLFVANLLASPFPANAELVDRSVAIVNNDIITLSEVNEVANPLFKKAAAEVPADELPKVIEQIKTSAIRKLIDQKLIDQEAQQMNVSVSDEEVDKTIKRIIEQNNITMDTFQSEINKVGMTLDLYKKDLKGQILRSKLVNYEVRSKVIIPEDKIIDYYDMYYTKQVGEGGYYVLQIGTSWKNPDKTGKKLSKEEAEEKIEKLHKLALGGDSFKQLAKEHSDLPSAQDGGDLGLFKLDEMAPFMRKAVANLNPGDISKIVETPSGYQFFSILSSQEGQIITKVPYESVKEEIREKLYQEEMKKNFEEWVKGIRENAYIKVL